MSVATPIGSMEKWYVYPDTWLIVGKCGIICHTWIAWDMFFCAFLLLFFLGGYAWNELYLRNLVSDQKNRKPNSIRGYDFSLWYMLVFICLSLVVSFCGTGWPIPKIQLAHRKSAKKPGSLQDWWSFRCGWSSSGWLEGDVVRRWCFQVCLECWPRKMIQFNEHIFLNGLKPPNF